MRWSIHATAVLCAGFGSLPAAARDCAAPGNAVDTAICTDPALKAANEEMAVALQAVLPLVDQKMALRLTDSQTTWDAALEERCGEQAVTDENRTGCILPEIAKRTAFLMASPRSGPGGPDRLVPYVFAQAHSETKCAGKVEAFDFGRAAKTPGEIVLASSLRDLVVALDAGPFARDAANDPDNRCAFSVYDPAITYASPALVAINLPTFFDDDAKDGHFDQQSLIADLAAGKMLNFSDVFPDAAKAHLISDCTQLLREQRIAGKGRQQGEAEPEPAAEPPPADWAQTVDREFKDSYAPVIAARVTDLRHWIVYADHAEVYFPEQSIGANVEGNFACRFTNAQLATYAGAKGWIVK